MARENFVYLLGAVAREPLISKKPGDDASSYAMCYVNVGRGNRDVGDGLPAAKAPDGRRTPVPAPPVLGEHLVVDEQFAYPHELLHFFAEFPDVVLDAGYEVCLDRVPVPAKPVWRHFGDVWPVTLRFHAYSIA